MCQWWSDLIFLGGKMDSTKLFILRVSEKFHLNKYCAPISYLCVCVCVSVCVRACVSVCVRVLSHVWLFMTPRTIARQSPLSMEFPRQEYWSGLPFPSPGDLPNPGMELESLASPALTGRIFITSAMLAIAILISVACSRKRLSLTLWVTRVDQLG